MINQIFYFLLFLVVSQFALAQNVGNFQISERQGEVWAPINLRTKVTYRWLNNQEGAREIRWSAIVETSWNLDYSASSTATPNTTIRSKGNRFLVETSSMETIVSLAGNRQLKLQWRSSKPLLVDDNCRKNALAFLAETSISTPFYIGVSCIFKNEQATLHLSFPNDVELSRSSLFETIGKGESYRVYDLKKITAAKTALGQFTFSYQGKNYNYSLFSQRGETNENKVYRSRFTAALGGGALSLKTVANTYKDTKPFAVLALRPQTLFSQLAAGINFESSIGSVESANVNTLSYFQVSGYATFRLPIYSAWEFQPRLYYVVSKQDSGSGIGYQTGQFGVGFWNEFKFTDRFSLWIEGMTEAIGSPVIKEHKFVEISLFYRDDVSEAGWTLAGQFQNYTVSDALANVRKFDQSFVVVKRSF